MQGPRSPGHYSDIPRAAQLKGVDRKGQVAAVDFNSAFFAGGGSAGMELRLAQVVFTLTQLPDVQAVQFLQDGKVKPAAGGEGVPTAEPLARHNFSTVAPPRVASAT